MPRGAMIDATMGSAEVAGVLRDDERKLDRAADVVEQKKFDGQFLSKLHAKESLWKGFAAENGLSVYESLSLRELLTEDQRVAAPSRVANRKKKTKSARTCDVSRGPQTTAGSSVSRGPTMKTAELKALLSGQLSSASRTVSI